MEQEPHPRLTVIICSSCNEPGFLSTEAVEKLMNDNNGRIETPCPHCTGTMEIPVYSTSLKTDETPRFFSVN